MEGSPFFFSFLSITIGLLGLFSLVVGQRMQRFTFSRSFFVVTIVPSLVMLGLFYSLVYYMQECLGAWPTSIGLGGFLPPLVAHANIVRHYFSILLFITIFVWPIVLLLFLFIERLRGLIFYLGTYAIAVSLSLLAIFLAPSPFLYWWWD